MKINWGTGIVIGFVVFISFIMFMVVKMMTQEEYNHDLVTQEYYKAELEYQNEIDAEKNAMALSEKLKIDKTKEGFLIQFPSNFESSKINGLVKFYRPSNKKLDFEIPISLSSSTLLIPDQNLLEGRWNINIDWSYEGIPYLNKVKTTY